MKRRKSRLALRLTAAFLAALFIGIGVFAACVKIIYPVKYRAEVDEYAAGYGLDSRLVLAVIKTESGFDPDAESAAGAVGLMQLMPATAEFIADKAGIGDIDGESLRKPEINIRLGCAYLRYLMNRFGDMRLCLCAYNAGEGSVAAWLINPDCSRDGKSLYKIPFKETEKYYNRVTRAEKVYRFIV